MRWLLVGALGSETLPVLRRLRRPRPVTARLVVGRHGDHEVGVLTVGVGPDKAADRTRAALVAWPPDRVVSFGTCGALVDDLAVGAIVSVQRLYRESALVGPVVPLDGFPPVALTSVAEPVHTAARRAILAGLGLQVVDMEAASVRQEAGALPFFALKIVSDAAGGHEDDPIGAPTRLAPARIARFLGRALKLVETRLAPALLAQLA